MLTAKPNTVDEKKDLHVGGLGSEAHGALAAVTDHIPSADSWLKTARAMAREADDFVRGNPWAALAAVAVAGVAAGYLLSQRSKG